MAGRVSATGNALARWRRGDYWGHSPLFRYACNVVRTVEPSPVALAVCAVSAALWPF